MLPFTAVRIDSGRYSKHYSLVNNWIPYQTHHQIAEFRLTCETLLECQNAVAQMQSKPRDFLYDLNVHFSFKLPDASVEVFNLTQDILRFSAVHGAVENTHCDQSAIFMHIWIWMCCFDWLQSYTYSPQGSNSGKRHYLQQIPPLIHCLACMW